MTRQGCALVVGMGIFLYSVCGQGFALDSAQSDEGRYGCLATEVQALSPTGGEMFDEFGSSVAVDGTVALIGVPGDDDLGSRAGAVQVLRHDGAAWVDEVKLTASDGEALADFGAAVAVSGDVAVIGAPHDDHSGTDSGAVYVFRFDGENWVEEEKLVPQVGAAFDEFGIAVAIEGGVVVVGSLHDGDPDVPRGAAWVFRYTAGAWVQEQKLNPPGEPGFDSFGHPVALGGDLLVVGAAGDNGMCACAGAAHVFRSTGTVWDYETKLSAADGAAHDEFGLAVAVADDWVLVGAPGADADGPNSGAAYVFEYVVDAWVEQQKLIATDAFNNDDFGLAVDLAGHHAVVGAPGDDIGGESAGSAYVYHEIDGVWIEGAKLVAADAMTHDHLGEAVALTETMVLVGAPDADTVGLSSGSAYVFDGFEDCNENGFFDACDILNGVSLDDNENGVPDECEAPDWCLGDMDCSGGSPDFADIVFFAAAVGNEAGWAQYYRDTHGGEEPPCPWLLGDFGGAVGVEFADIVPFANSVGQDCVVYMP